MSMWYTTVQSLKLQTVIRCANSQLYAHSMAHCWRKSICAYCARGHSSNSRPYSTQKDMMKCTNCIHREDYCPHTADSWTCPTFLKQIKYRNNIPNSFMNSHMGTCINSSVDSYMNSYMNSYINSNMNSFNTLYTNYMPVH